MSKEKLRDRKRYGNTERVEQTASDEPQVSDRDRPKANTRDRVKPDNRKRPRSTALARAARKLRPPPGPPPPGGPKAELRRLVDQHVAITKRGVAVLNMQTDKEARKDIPTRGIAKGDKIPNPLPDDLRADFRALRERCVKECDDLEKLMMRQLKLLPIWTMFLSKVYGVGPVIASYLIAMIDFAKATKISNLQRYCGLAVDRRTGRLERPTPGEKLPYNQELRVRLYQLFAAMWKNGVGRDMTSKYLQVWFDYKNRMQHSERVDIQPDPENPEKFIRNHWLPFGKTEWQPGARAFIHSAGWHKAADVFLEDLYVIGRTLEGLPVWPSYYAAKLGYEHGGKICMEEPRMLTIDQALEMVGDVGGHPVAAAAE